MIFVLHVLRGADIRGEIRRVVPIVAFTPRREAFVGREFAETGQSHQGFDDKPRMAWSGAHGRLGNVEDMILSLYARGMSTRDISAHLEEIYGASVSAATISRVTDVVADEIAAWQARPVDAGQFPVIVANQLVMR